LRKGKAFRGKKHFQKRAERTKKDGKNFPRKKNLEENRSLSLSASKDVTSAEGRQKKKKKATGGEKKNRKAENPNQAALREVFRRQAKQRTFENVREKSSYRVRSGGRRGGFEKKFKKRKRRDEFEGEKNPPHLFISKVLRGGKKGNTLNKKKPKRDGKFKRQKFDRKAGLNFRDAHLAHREGEANRKSRRGRSNEGGLKKKKDIVKKRRKTEKSAR